MKGANKLSVAEHRAVRNTVDIVILTAEDIEMADNRKLPDKGIQVVLIKRDEEPYDGMWTLPGGFVDYDKTLSDCVKDKLEEKVGLRDIYIEQLYTYGDNLYRDPRDRVLTIGYLAITDKQAVNLGGSKDATWFWIDTVSRDETGVKDISFRSVDTNEIVSELGFDHKEIIVDALNRLANKISYTNIGFNFLPEEFTMSDVEKVHEAILGHPLNNFYRFLKDKLIDTGKTTLDIKGRNLAFRPSKVYKLKTYEGSK